MTLYRDVHNPLVADLAGVDAIVSDPVEVIASQHVTVVDSAPIVSDPVSAVAMNCGPMIASVDAENAAWRHAFGVIPMHHNGDGSVAPCCNDFKSGCEARRQELVNQVLGVPDPDAESVELKADPITAMAHDHIRLAKPNRTRSRD